MSEVDNASRPVECYEFEIAGAGAFRYTSDEQSVLAESKLYNPLPGLSRSEIGIVSTSEAADMTITLPASAELARRVALTSTPDKVTLAFRRYQRTNLNSPVGIFDAVLQDSSITDDVCTLKFPDAIQNALGMIVPAEKIQPMCNNQFGDEDCKIDPNDHRILFIGAALIPGFHGPVGPYRYSYSGVSGVSVLLRNLVGATLKVTTGSIGGPQVQTRTINQVFTFGGTVPGFETAGGGIIYINQPLNPYTPQSNCEIIAGCSKDYMQCRAYNNYENFFGFPYVPTEKLNPFRLRFDRNK